MITVSSTTETKEALQAAANYGLKTGEAEPPEQPEVENEEHPEVDKTETGAESEPARDDESEPPEQPEEEEEEPEEEEPDKPVGKTRRKLLRRLSRLHSENLTLQERLEAAEAKLRGTKPAEAVSDAKPDPKNFKDYEAYIEALADWKMEQRDKQRAKTAQDEFLKSMFDDYNQQIEAARETHDDFDDVVNTSAQVPIIAINAMYEMENGAEVAYYLAKHADVRAELLEYNEPGHRGGVRKILATLDRISAELSPSKSSPSRSNGDAPVRHRPQSAAPAPIRPVGSGASTRSSVEPGKLPYKDYVKWYGQKYGTRR